MIKHTIGKIIIIIIPVALLFFSCKSELEFSSGLKGMVIRGPINGGPEIVGQINYEPFSAFFHITGQTNSFKSTFNTDENGEFSLQLPAGIYFIVPDKTAPLMMPESQTKEVTVLEDSIASIILNFDTGIR